MSFLCRDCFTGGEQDCSACPACGSQRVVVHPELNDLSLAHVDCDAFYAAVEKRDNPSLRKLPVIIGGGRRGVVATACYVARRYGVRSAMPMFEARERCPEAVIIKPNMEKYKAVAKQVRRMFSMLTPLVEAISIDEAYLDLHGTCSLHGASPAKLLAQLSQDVMRKVGVTISVGLSHNKLLAKIASDLNKPRGFSVIGRSDAKAVLAPMPVRVLPGVGPVMERKLKELQLHTVGDVMGAEPNQFRSWGAAGRRLQAQAQGEDERAVTPEREARSVSSEITLDVDESDVQRLREILREQSETLARRLRRQRLAGRVVFLKLKTSQFESLTRQRTTAMPVQGASELYALVVPLLRKVANGQAFRLIGIGVRELSEVTARDPTPDSLFDTPQVEDRRVDDAIENLRNRFGDKVIRRGALPRRKLFPQGPAKH